MRWLGVAEDSGSSPLWCRPVSSLLLVGRDRMWVLLCYHDGSECDMKRLTMLVIVLVLLASSVPVGAQDGGELKCDTTTFNDLLGTFAQTLLDAQGAEPEAQYEAMVGVKARIASLDGPCLGLDFGADHDIVTDPVYVPAGIYRATLQAQPEDSLFATGIVISGDCGRLGEIELFYLAADGDQSVVQSTGCALIWEVKSVDGPFMITFEKLN